MFGRKKKPEYEAEEPQEDDEFTEAANEERKIKKQIEPREIPKEQVMVRAVSEADMLNILAEKIDLNTKYLAWIVEYIKRNQ